jgi:hypothetical protein
METERPFNPYETTSTDYGTNWPAGNAFQQSFTQSTPYKTLTNTRQVQPHQLPNNRESIALVHDPAHPCGIMTMSNIPTNLRGEFTNVRRDYQSDRQGLWANANFNTPGATIDRGVGTYSNLQGAWARVGPSTYDATHGQGDWVHKWGIHSYEPATLRSLYDHKNVDPSDNWVPVENVPQNMWNGKVIGYNQHF